jgi:hypothetical protein
METPVHKEQRPHPDPLRTERELLPHRHWLRWSFLSGFNLPAINSFSYFSLNLHTACYYPVSCLVIPESNARPFSFSGGRRWRSRMRPRDLWTALWSIAVNSNVDCLFSYSRKQRCFLRQHDKQEALTIGNRFIVEDCLLNAVLSVHAVRRNDSFIDVLASGPKKKKTRSKDWLRLKMYHVKTRVCAPLLPLGGFSGPPIFTSCNGTGATAVTF